MQTETKNSWFPPHAEPLEGGVVSLMVKTWCENRGCVSRVVYRVCASEGGSRGPQRKRNGNVPIPTGKYGWRPLFSAAAVGTPAFILTTL